MPQGGLGPARQSNLCSGAQGARAPALKSCDAPALRCQPIRAMPMGRTSHSGALKACMGAGCQAGEARAPSPAPHAEACAHAPCMHACSKASIEAAAALTNHERRQHAMGHQQCHATVMWKLRKWMHDACASQHSLAVVRCLACHTYSKSPRLPQHMWTWVGRRTDGQVVRACRECISLHSQPPCL